MDEAEVAPRPRSRSNSDMTLSEEEMGAQLVTTDENKQREESFAMSAESALPAIAGAASSSSSRPPTKRLRNSNSSDDQQIVDNEGFTLVQRKKTLAATGKYRRSTEKGNNKLNVNSFEVCVSSYQMLPKQIGLAMLLKSEGIINVIKITYKSPYRVVISFENKEDANKLVQSKTFMDSGYRCYMTDEVGITYGVVKYLELDVKDQDLMASIRCEQDIVSVKRLNRMSEEGQWVSSETVRFGFKSSTLPSYVFGYGVRFKVDPYTFPVTQCASCWKFGHLTRTCPTKKPVCPKCGGGHENCETTEYRCINCKDNHMALSKSCPIYLKEKEIRSIMCTNNCTYKVALSKYMENKTCKFDECAQNTPSFFMFGDKSNVRTYERVRPTMSYSQCVGTKTEVTINSEKPDTLIRIDGGEVSEDESKDSSEENLFRKKPSRGMKKKHKVEKRQRKVTAEASRDPPVITATGEGTQLDSGQKKKINFVGIFRKAKEIVFSDKSFEEKVTQVLKLLFEELMSFVVQMISKGDVLTKLLSLLYDG